MQADSERGSTDGSRPDAPPTTRVGPAEFGRGELSARDAAEFNRLKRLIQSRAGLYCDGYKERVLRRRIAVRMRARGTQTFAAYTTVLKRDAAEFERLIDTITINVSKFFRNASSWVLLREQVVPSLFALDSPTIRIWSAGSAAGEEAYSITILLLQHIAEHGGDIGRFEILATDVDEDALEQAVRAEYGPFAFGEMAESTRSRWFHGPKQNQLVDEVKQHVRFEKLDLMKDAFPESQHLVFCRNVLIYFERDVQQAMFRRFHAALTLHGYLQLGKVETLFGAPRGLFETISARERLFQRS